MKTAKAKKAPRRPASTSIADLKPDTENRRLHNARNIEMVVESIQQVGAARSIVIDEDGKILAGNGVTEGALAAGLTKLRIVDAAGDELIAVRRRGLTPDQKRSLALYDNRTGELSTWNAAQLSADVAAGLELKPFFFPDELEKITAAAGPGTHPVSFEAVDENLQTEHKCPKCGYEWSGKASAKE